MLSLLRFLCAMLSLFFIGKHTLPSGTCMLFGRMTRDNVMGLLDRIHSEPLKY